MEVLGVDLGGTKLATAVFTGAGERVASGSVPLGSRRGKEAGSFVSSFIGSEIENIKFSEVNYSTFNNRSLYSDIDLNQHLTTTRYFDWIFDTYDMNFHRKFQCKELVANFSREISFGEMIQIRRFDLQGNNFSSVLSFQSNSETEHFKGKIDFKEKFME